MKKDIWEELDNPKYPAIADLMSWATNYDFHQSPWSLFLDIIDWSGEHVGEKLAPNATLDYISRPLVANAILELDAVGEKAWNYINELEGLMLEAS